MPERRRNQRADVEIKVRTRADAEESFARIANLSLNGLFVNEILPYPPGAVVDVSFLLPNDGTLIEARAEVVHARDLGRELRPEEERLPGHGLRFLELDEESREALAVYLGEDSVELGG